MKRHERIGRIIGRQLGIAMNVGTGYVWAEHGVLAALGIWGLCLVFFLALYGAAKYPWGKTA